MATNTGTSNSKTIISAYNARMAQQDRLAQQAAQRVSSAGAGQAAAKSLLANETTQGGNAPSAPSAPSPDTEKTVVFQDRSQNDKRIADSNAAIIARKASEDRAKLAIQQRQAEREERKLREKQQRQANLLRKEALIADEAMANVSKATSPYLTWFAHVKTPGGLLTLVLILLFFLIAVTPVNTHGDTRLKLMWLTLLGKTSLNYNASSINNASTSSSSNSSKNGNSSTNGTVPPNIDLFSFLNTGLS
jgi:hypothetical protein